MKEIENRIDLVRQLEKILREVKGNMNVKRKSSKGLCFS